MSLLNIRAVSFQMLERADVPVKTFSAGETIVSAGDDAREMYVVRRGRIEIRVNGKPVEEIGESGIFGEMALIDHSKRSADAVALEASEVIPIDERLFVILVQDTPYFALDVMRILTERLRIMNKKLVE
jgi:CRP/FNR family transcriptional regulator, cyclic AMP receptor protein